MKIGILQTGHVIDEVQAEMGDYADVFERLLGAQNFSFSRYWVVDGEFPKSAADADGWLLTGSRHGVYEDLPWIKPLEEFVREVHALGRPMVGICFGHQIIAQALGGKVEKFDGGWAVGHQDYAFTDGSTMRLNAWHQDQVTVLPKGATVTASNDFCKNAAFLLGDKIMTIQPHPEFDARMMQLLLTMRGPGIIPDHILKRATEGLEIANDSTAYSQRIIDFFKEAQHG